MGFSRQLRLHSEKSREPILGKGGGHEESAESGCTLKLESLPTKEPSQEGSVGREATSDPPLAVEDQPIRTINLLLC